MAFLSFRPEQRIHTFVGKHRTRDELNTFGPHSRAVCLGYLSIHLACVYTRPKQWGADIYE